MANTINDINTAKDNFSDIITKDINEKLTFQDTEVYSIVSVSQFRFSEINAPNLTNINGPITLSKNNFMQALYLPKLTQMNDFSLIQNPNLTGVTLSNSLSTVGGAIVIEDNPVLEAFSMRFVTGDTFSIKVTGNDSLTSVSFAGLDLVGNVNISNNSTLVQLSLSDEINSLDIRCHNNALSEGDVDAVLFNIDNAGYSNGYLALSGGTNSAPSAAGLVNKSSLISKGWTVNNN